MHDLTAAHWVYLIGVVTILATMLARKNIVVPAVFFTFLTALFFQKSLAGGLAAVFNASLVAAQQLFNIFLIIALVTAMLGSLKALGADTKMVAPFRPVMRNGHLAFWTLAVVTYVISLFFWPTPAVPLIGAVLIPVAIRAGLRPMAVAFTIAIAGQGMALSSDFVIRVAPGLSATAAGRERRLGGQPGHGPVPDRRRLRARHRLRAGVPPDAEALAALARGVGGHRSAGGEGEGRRRSRGAHRRARTRDRRGRVLRHGRRRSGAGAR